MAKGLILPLLMLGACAAEPAAPGVEEERRPKRSAAASRPAAEPSAAPAIELPRTRWEVIAVNGRATPGGPRYHISFDRYDRGQITAGFGCNSFQGAYRINGDHLATDGLVGTEMACGDAAGTLERLGVAVLGSNMRIEPLQQGRIRLVSEAGSIDLKPALPPAATTGEEAYVARGQEPGWLLTIADGWLDYRGNYGEKRIRVRAPQLISTINGELFQTERLHVHIIHMRCNDAMSGHGYADTVQVTADGETYRGCGGERRPDWDA